MHLAAQIWHYWIGVVFFVLSILAVIGVIIGYVVKVQSLKYPKR
jgi:Na+-transporting methylmalonyl-CoA/oxaloacetate decarboxylase gamma subunit